MESRSSATGTGGSYALASGLRCPVCGATGTPHFAYLLGEKVFTGNVYPAHDYPGRHVSSISQEKVPNPRLEAGKSLAEFPQAALSHAMCIDYAVPGKGAKELRSLPERPVAGAGKVLPLDDRVPRADTSGAHTARQASSGGIQPRAAPASGSRMVTNSSAAVG